MLVSATIAGVVVGLTVVSLAILTGSDFWIFVNLPGFLIVVGGTLAAIMIKFPMSGTLLAFPAGLKAAFTNKKDSPRDYIRDAIKLSKIGREQGMLVLDQIKLRNPFFQQGVQLCADGCELPYIQKILSPHMSQVIQEEEMGTKIFAAIGKSAPAFGMFGSLAGLIQMLSNMNDANSLGPVMTVAFLTHCMACTWRTLSLYRLPTNFPRKRAGSVFTRKPVTSASRNTPMSPLRIGNNGLDWSNKDRK